MYTLELTETDVETIALVGDRYSWASVLSCYPAGIHYVEEIDAWEIQLACEDDCEGGHGMFPMLDPRSELAEKLSTFLESIV